MEPQSTVPELATYPWWFATMFVATWVCYVPLSYLAYVWTKAPKRLRKDQLAISRFSDGHRLGDDARAIVQTLLHDGGDFLWPVAMATTVPVLMLVVYLPFTRTLMSPILTEIWPDYLGQGNPTESIAAISRVVLWGYTGAFFYSFTTLWRRFMALDITPNVYTYVGIRFLTAIVTGGVVGAVVGIGVAAVGTPVSPRGVVPILATVFVVGMFPDVGVAYLTAYARKVLGAGADTAVATPLTQIAGLDPWHEGRLRQEGIDNAENLAATDLEYLVRALPFSLGQLVDWVDEAILLTRTGSAQFQKLTAVGVRHASTVKRAVGSEDDLARLADVSGLGRTALQVIALSMEASTNLRAVMLFRQGPPPVIPAGGASLPSDRPAGASPGANLPYPGSAPPPSVGQ